MRSKRRQRPFLGGDATGSPVLLALKAGSTILCPACNAAQLAEVTITPPVWRCVCKCGYRFNVTQAAW
jgi:uncharacterized protein (DUF983 family)